MSNLDALFKITHGMYLLTAHSGRDNGCIIDAVMQITATPERIVIGVGNDHLTNELIAGSGRFCLSPLTVSADDGLIARFGFSSGRNEPKFDSADGFDRSPDGLLFLTRHAAAALFCRVEGATDYGTHTLFTGAVESSEILSDERLMTYNDYRERKMNAAK